MLDQASEGFVIVSLKFELAGCRADGPSPSAFLLITGRATRSRTVSVPNRPDVGCTGFTLPYDASGSFAIGLFLLLLSGNARIAIPILVDYCALALASHDATIGHGAEDFAVVVQIA